MMNNIRHIGIIPDGTRRWSKKHDFLLENAYIIAFDKLCSFIDTFYGCGINSISVYLASSNNLLKRNQYDLTALDNSLCNFFQERLLNLLNKWHPHVVHVGLTQSISDFKFYRPLEEVLKEFSCGHKRLYLLMGYDPFEEIKATLDVSCKNMNENEMVARLWVPECLDIVLRTGDANTLSRFLPLQSSTARVYFLGEMFNDVTIEKLLSILEEFKNLHLKFGE